MGKEKKEFQKWLNKEDKQNWEIERYVEDLLEAQREDLLKKIEWIEKRITTTSKAYTSNDFEKELFEEGCCQVLEDIKKLIK